jgi:tRNA1(Val) A37 N6-methylase TrmN6
MAEHWPEDALSRDEFLGGQLRLWQPKQGYRAGVDPVLLAASVPARAGDAVLDLGCGAGVAALCVAQRVPGVQAVGLEVQPGYADLARRNADENGLALEVFEGDLAQMPDPLKQRQFTHVLANPPYFDRNASTKVSDAGREVARGEATPLEAWVEAAAKRCAPKGTVTLIQRAERLPEMLSHAARHLGSLEVMPLIPRKGRAARLVLLRGRKGGRAAFRLHDGWLLHEGGSHPGDRENYNAATTCILRLGEPLLFLE